MSGPLISVVLPVKNAMPHLRGMVDSLRRQTFRDFELIVQDGASTDTTLSYLSSVEDLPRLDIVSEPDGGIGQAYNRGMARANGEWICLVAADEWLDDDALERGVQWFARHPDAAAIYGAIRLADGAGHTSQIYVPPAFDLARFVHNEFFPTANAFLNRKQIGPDLYYDESLKTCPDYDFWIRLGGRFGTHGLVVVPEPIATNLIDRTSMSYRVEAFDQFIADKRFILDRYAGTLDDPLTAVTLRTSASAGILTWAAESVFAIGGVTADFLKWCREAAGLDPHSPRLARLARRSEAFEIDASGRFVVNASPQPGAPAGDTQSVDGLIEITALHSHPSWNPAEVRSGTPTRVITGPGSWHYSALLPLAAGNGLDRKRWYWAKLNVRVQYGQVGIGLLAPDDILSERMIVPEDGRLDVFVRLNHPDATGIMIRNGSLGGPSTVEIFSATVECALKTTLAMP
jgi:glycosyltransferase involved in cell wall biosynthesis